MTPTAQNLRRVFYEGFVARDLAEPLASFDITASIETVRAFMFSRPLSVIGIREQGVVTGVIEQEFLDDRELALQVRQRADVSVLPTTSPLRDVVAVLDAHSFVLVETLGHPVGVIVRAHLEKPPMRMWLFGMVTLFEMSITRILSSHYDDEAWTPHLAESRIAKARELQRERLRRKEAVELLDCLQLSDKGQLFSCSDDLRVKYWDRSKRQIAKVVKELEGLRNNLAHSQPFIGQNWDAIVRLADALDSLLELPSELTSRDSFKPDA